MLMMPPAPPVLCRGIVASQVLSSPTARSHHFAPAKQTPTKELLQSDGGGVGWGHGQKRGALIRLATALGLSRRREELPEDVSLTAIFATFARRVCMPRHWILELSV